MINKISWNVALILIGIVLIGVLVPQATVLAGIALIVAGVSGLAGV